MKSLLLATIAVLCACATNPPSESEPPEPMPDGYAAAAERLETLLAASMSTGANWEVNASACRLVVVRISRYRTASTGGIIAVRRSTWGIPLGEVIRIAPDDPERLIRVWTTKNAVDIIVEDTHGDNERRMDTIYTINFDFAKRDNTGEVQDALLTVTQMCGARPYVERSR